jgi:hypothetical protein
MNWIAEGAARQLVAILLWLTAIALLVGMAIGAAIVWLLA